MSADGYFGQVAEDDDDIPFEVRATLFVMLPVWVQLSASPMAWATYAALALHINQKRGDRKVWPTQDTIAKRLGLKNAKAIRPYLAELEALGAIKIKSQRYAGGMKARNVYYLRMDPPPGFTGPQRLEDVPDESDESPVGDATKLDKTMKAAGRSVGCSSTPSEGSCSTPSEGCSSTPELDEEKLDEEELKEEQQDHVGGGGRSSRARAKRSLKVAPKTTTTPVDAPSFSRRVIKISANTFPLTDEMRARVAEHLGHLELDEENLKIQHNNWTLRHAGKSFTEDKAMDLWWGWMGKAERRCTDPAQLALEGSDLAAAERMWPDIDVSYENDLFIEKAREQGLHFPSKQGWLRAWEEHMQEAQDFAVEAA